MNRRILLIVTLGISTATFSFAEVETSVPAKKTATTSSKSFAAAQLIKASEMIGMDVKNPQSERLGEIKDVMVDLKEGRIIYAVLASGGFLGMGEKYMALPASALRISSDTKHLVLDADIQSIESAPGLDKNNWPPVAQNFKSNRAAKVAANNPKRLKGQLVSKKKYASKKNFGSEIKEAAGSARIPDDSQTKNSGSATKASDLIGWSVKSPQEERLGDLKDLALDLAASRVVYAVLSTGGFLGIGDKLFAVPTTAFNRSTEVNTLVLKADKEILSAAASFGKNNWPSAPDPTWSTPIYIYHGPERGISSGKQIIDPSGARAVTDADKTRHNAQDRDGKKLTASDQSNSKEDISLTRDLRRAVMTDPTLSFLAKNITIISINGKITLRGSVKNDAERKEIQAQAQRIGANALDNQLEVKNK